MGAWKGVIIWIGVCCASGVTANLLLNSAPSKTSDVLQENSVLVVYRQGKPSNQSAGPPPEPPVNGSFGDGLSEESGKKDHPYMKRKSIIARRRIVPQKNPSYPPYYVNKGGGYVMVYPALLAIAHKHPPTGLPKTGAATKAASRPMLPAKPPPKASLAGPTLAMVLSMMDNPYIPGGDDELEEVSETQETDEPLA